MDFTLTIRDWLNAASTVRLVMQLLSVPILLLALEEPKKIV
jgi:hypothetical protein